MEEKLKDELAVLGVVEKSGNEGTPGSFSLDSLLTGVPHLISLTAKA